MPFFKSKKPKKKSIFAKRNEMLDDIFAFGQGGADIKDNFKNLRKKGKKK